MHVRHELACLLQHVTELKTILNGENYHIIVIKNKLHVLNCISYYIITYC